MKHSKPSLLSAFASTRLCCAVLAAAAIDVAQPFSLRNFGGELNSTRLVKTTLEHNKAGSAGRTKPLQGSRLRNGDRRLLLEKDKLKGRLFNVSPLPSF